MPKGFAVVIAFLIVMAWQYRKNKPLLFAIVATLFACAALLSTRWENISDLPLRVFALSWLACMPIAGILAAKKVVLSVRKKKRDEGILNHRSGTR
jgi:uncharacterized membrane protein